MHKQKRSRRLRRALRRAGYRGARSDDALPAGSTPNGPQPSRPVAQAPFVLSSGTSRYQRKTAGLPKGIVGFPGLGVEAPQITIDLTDVDAELAEWTTAPELHDASG